MTVAPAEAQILTSQPLATQSPGFITRLLRRKTNLVCVGYLLVLVGVAIVAPIVLPDVAHQRAGNLLAINQGPSWEHLLGTDSLGRDVLDRLLVGTRIALVGVVEALAVVLLISVPVGLAAGYFGGRFDRAVGRVVDVSLALPGLILILVVLAVFPQSMLAGMVCLGILASPALIRVVRSAVLPVKEELYIAAARVSGLSRPRIIGRHILPRVSAPIIVQASLIAAVALLVQTGLAFLHLVVAPPAPSWGGMVADGVSVIVLQPWLIWPPGAAIGLTVVALGLLGDGVSDATVENWSPPIKPREHKPLGVISHEAPAPALTSIPSLLSVDGLSADLTLRSGDLVPVIQDVSFEIGHGEAVGLVGESGCGKTVTAMSVLGLLPTAIRLREGSILLDGRELVALSARDLHRIRGKEIGLISQEPMASLNPSFRIGSQLAEVVRRHQSVSRRAAQARAIDLLSQVQLPNPEAVARRHPHELSGGMAQRVAIARALAGEPKLLVADEPTTALDVTLQAEIIDLLRELCFAHGMAVLLVTHDWGVVADLCERVIVMYAGEVVERAPVRELFHTPHHPYTEALLRANPRGVRDTDVLPTIPGTVPSPGSWPAGCRFHPRCRYALAECVVGQVPLKRLAPDRDSRCIRTTDLAESG